MALVVFSFFAFQFVHKRLRRQICLDSKVLKIQSLKMSANFSGLTRFSRAGPARIRERINLNQVVDLIKSGKSEQEIAEECPTAYKRYRSGIRELLHPIQPKRDWKTTTIILWGKPGVGKLAWARNLAAQNDDWRVFMKPPGKWWDGYCSHEVVIVDNFDSKIDPSTLLKITDRFPLQVEVRHSFTQFSARLIIFTSTVHPRHWYKGSPKRKHFRLDGLMNRTSLLLHLHSAPSVEEADSIEQVSDSELE